MTPPGDRLHQAMRKNRNTLFDLAAAPTLLAFGGGSILLIVVVAALLIWAIVGIIRHGRKKNRNG